MEEILAITLKSMHQDMSRLDRIAMNLANAQTPGYKREVVAVRPFGQMVDSLAGAALSASASTAAPAESSLSLHTDQRPGTLKSTGQSLDVALGGTGYFEVLTPQGPAYTRQGNFRLDARGRLVTAQGYPVMGKGGEIFLNNPSPVIDATGQVFDTPVHGAAAGRSGDAPATAQLRVVQFDPSDTLQRLGEGLVAGGANPQAASEKDIQVRQGFIENSNVSSMHEMVQMIQTMRHFESMQKVATGYDDMMAAAIRKLGDQS